MKLEKLTDDQLKLLEVKKNEWIRHGLSTERTDQDKVRAALKTVYESAGLPVPETIYWEQSPKAGAARAKELLGRVDDDICYGAHDAGWLAFYDTMGELGLEEEVKPLRGVIEMGKLAGWWWPYDEAVIVTDRPTEIHRDEDGRLHNETGAAVLYSDGFGVWALHGLRVTQQIIEAPETLTVDQIKGERNAEVRRAMIERYGAERFLQASNAKVRHQDDRGILYEFPDDRDITICEVVNATAERDGKFERFWLIGPGTVRKADEFVAASFGLTVQEYTPSVES